MQKVCFIGKDLIPEEIVLDRGEELDLTLIALPGVSGDVPVRILLNGEGASARLFGLYLCNSDEQVKFGIDLRHNVGGCFSRQLFKGIAGGSSKVDFYGKIYVRKDAQGTKAYQENHSILLSPGAQVETKPQLEIYADDVECSHGATVGHFNDDELYYMQSRGIDKKNARRLQMISFISPVVEHITDEGQKQMIYDYLSEC